MLYIKNLKLGGNGYKEVATIKDMEKILMLSWKANQTILTGIINNFKNIGNGLIDIANEILQEDPNFFDDFEPDFTLEASSRNIKWHKRSPLGFSLFGYDIDPDPLDLSGIALDDVVTPTIDFVDQTIDEWKHPWDKFNRDFRKLTGGLRQLANYSVQLTNLPGPLVTGIVAAGISEYKAGHKCTPYHCKCKGTLKAFKDCVQYMNDASKEYLKVAFNFIKGYADEISTNYSPTKIGGFVSQIWGNMVLGIVEGCANNSIDEGTAACKGWTLIGKNCDYENGANSHNIGLERLQKKSNVLAASTELLKRIESYTEELGRTIARMHTAHNVSNLERFQKELLSEGKKVPTMVNMAKAILPDFKQEDFDDDEGVVFLRELRNRLEQILGADLETLDDWQTKARIEKIFDDIGQHIAHQSEVAKCDCEVCVAGLGNCSLDTPKGVTDKCGDKNYWDQLNKLIITPIERRDEFHLLWKIYEMAKNKFPDAISTPPQVPQGT